MRNYMKVQKDGAIDLFFFNDNDDADANRAAGEAHAVAGQHRGATVAVFRAPRGKQELPPYATMRSVMPCSPTHAFARDERSVKAEPKHELGWTCARCAWHVTPAAYAAQ